MKKQRDTEAAGVEGQEFAPVPQEGDGQPGKKEGLGVDTDGVPTVGDKPFGKRDIRSLLLEGVWRNVSGSISPIPTAGGMRPGGFPLPGREEGVSLPEGRADVRPGTEDELEKLLRRSEALDGWKRAFDVYLLRKREAEQPRDEAVIWSDAVVRQQRQSSETARVTDLLREHDAVRRGVGTHPLTLRRRKEAAEAMGKEAAGLQAYYDGMYEKQLQRFGNPVGMRSPEAFYVPKTGEMELVGSAMKNFRDARDLLEAPSVYDGEKSGTGNFFRGMGNRLSDRDFWTMGISEMARNLETSGIASKIEAAGERDLEEVLSRGEQALLQSWMAKMEALAAREGDLSLGYQAGQAGTDVLGAAVEAAVFGGVGKIATASARKGLMKFVAKRMGRSGVLGRGLAKGAAWAGSNALRGSVSTALRPATYVNISRRLADFERDGEGAVVLDNRGLPRRKSLADAVAEGLAESFVDNFSDGTVKPLQGAWDTGRRLAASRLPKATLQGVKEMGERLARSAPGEMYGRLSKMPAYRFLVGKVGGEAASAWSDEAFGELLKTAVLDDRDLDDFFSFREQLKTAVALLPVAFARGVVDKAGLLKTKALYRDELARLQRTLDDVGTSGAKALKGRIETLPADEFAAQVASLAEEVAGNDREAARRLGRSALAFGCWRSYYHLKRGMFLEQPGAKSAPDGHAPAGLPSGLPLPPAGREPVLPGLSFDDIEGRSLTLVQPKGETWSRPSVVEVNDRSFPGDAEAPLRPGRQEGGLTGEGGFPDASTGELPVVRDYSRITDPGELAEGLRQDFGEDALPLLEEMLAEQRAKLADPLPGATALERARRKLGHKREIERLEQARERMSRTEAATGGDATGETVADGEAATGKGEASLAPVGVPPMAGDLGGEPEAGNAVGVAEGGREADALPRQQAVENVERSFNKEGFGVIDWALEHPGGAAGWGTTGGLWPTDEAAGLKARIEDVLKDGKVVRHGKRRVSIVKGGCRATLRRGTKGHWALTAFELPPGKPSASALPSGGRKGTSPLSSSPSPSGKEGMSGKGGAEEKPGRAKVRHFDGHDYSGEVVDMGNGRLSLRDERTGRIVGVPLKNVVEIDGIPQHNR